MKTNERTGQLEKRLVRSTELLPTDQEPARAIEPREEPLHDPTPGLFGRLQTAGRLRFGWMLLEGFPIPRMVFGIQPRMRFIATFIEVSVDHVIIIACIQAQVVRLLHGGLRPLIALGI